MGISVIKISSLADLTNTRFLGYFSKRSKHIFCYHMPKTTISFSRIWMAVDFWRPKLCEISVQICNLKNWTPVTFKWNAIFSVLFLLCFRARLFIDALWSPAGKGLTSWLSFVMSICEVVTFSLVSWVRCGARLYRFMIFALFLTFICFLVTTSVNLLLYALPSRWTFRYTFICFTGLLHFAYKWQIIQA